MPLRTKELNHLESEGYSTLSTIQVNNVPSAIKYLQPPFSIAKHRHKLNSNESLELPIRNGLKRS